uniref:Uncharacterized protein n=1 Tax=viral metagenome TaxID=1070528 RepID=A0A6H1ZFR7_9ZZZZ
MTYKMRGSIFYSSPALGIPPRTIELSDTPTVLDVADGNIEETQIIQISMYCSENFYLTHAENETDAATNLASAASRAYLPKGFYSFDVSGMDREKLYLKSTDGSSYAAAISLIFSERD